MDRQKKGLVKFFLLSLFDCLQDGIGCATINIFLLSGKIEMERIEEEMKKYFVFLISIFLIFLTACGGGKEEGTAYTEVNVEEGITLALKEDTLKTSGATFILANDTGETIHYSTNEYHFEQMKDGQWEEFTGTANSNWGDETSDLEAGEKIELSYVWKTFCGATTEGTQYRLIILVNDSPVAAEFTGV